MSAKALAGCYFGDPGRVFAAVAEHTSFTRFPKMAGCVPLHALYYEMNNSPEPFRSQIFAEQYSMTFNFEKSKSYLVCPKCHSDLVPDGDSLVCTNPQVRLRYPILEDIPRLLVEEAEVLTPEAWTAAMHRAGRR